MMQETRLQLSERMCRNIYYMLCYTPDELQYMESGQIHFENVQGVDDLLAALLCNSLDIWERNKMLREYKLEEKKTDKPKGRIDFIKSYASGSIANGKLVCRYHKLDNDTDPNRVIKLALSSILKYGNNINKEYMGKIAKKLGELTDIKNITLEEYVRIPTSFRDVPLYYRPILAASRIVIENILANTYNKDTDQLTELFKLEDDRRYQYIFEKFVRNYYTEALEKLGISVSKPVYNMYNTHDEITENTEKNGWDSPDIVLKRDDRAMVIDTKWYTKADDSSQVINRNIDKMYKYTDICIDRDENIYTIHGVVLYAKNSLDKIEDNKAFNHMTKSRGVYKDRYQRVINIDDEFDNIKKNLLKIASGVFDDIVA